MLHSLRPPAWLDPRAAYVHIPFCGHHCGYCDFAVTAGRDHLIEPYLDALERDLATLGTPRPVESLFVGGGTPTYLTARQLDRLFTALNRWLPVHAAIPEVTVESTPDSLDAEKVDVLTAAGVNRISIGVQSFQSDLLVALDRQHGVEQIPRAVEAVRRFGAALSFDLIFATPGQTLARWTADIDAALQYQPEHLSTYGLTYEKGTPLWKDRARGRLVPVPEDDELAMYDHAIDVLGSAGFEHYEVSNFARPGRRSIHNQRYWANHAYYGFGVGAAQYVNGVRDMNVRDTALYINKMLAGEAATFQREELTPRDRAFETAATQIRRADGIDYEQFQIQTGFDPIDLFGSRLRGLIENGLIRDDGRTYRLTRRGFHVADAVVTDILRASW